jgi:predicted RNA-binding Zn ribbon-like protein
VETRFTFHRGSPALDFAGTVGHRAGTPEERLTDCAALEAWLREAGLIGRGVHATDRELAEARALREAIVRAGLALADERSPARADLSAIDAAARWSALATPALDPRTLARRWDTSAPVRAALGRIAADAIDVFANRRERLVRCELPGCGALLLSQSRGPTRRWCSMETCGNVAKVAAHRARARTAAGDA